MSCSEKAAARVVYAEGSGWVPAIDELEFKSRAAKNSVRLRRVRWPVSRSEGVAAVEEVLGGAGEWVVRIVLAGKLWSSVGRELAIEERAGEL